MITHSWPLTHSFTITRANSNHFVVLTSTIIGRWLWRHTHALMHSHQSPGTNPLFWSNERLKRPYAFDNDKIKWTSIKTFTLRDLGLGGPNNSMGPLCNFIWRSYGPKKFIIHNVFPFMKAKIHAICHLTRDTLSYPSGHMLLLHQGNVMADIAMTCYPWQIANMALLP